MRSDILGIDTFRILGIATGITLMLVVANMAHAAEIYIYQRDNGTRLVTDHKRLDANLRLIRSYGVKPKPKPMRFQVRNGVIVESGAAAKPKPKFKRRSLSGVRPLKSRYDELIDQVANEHGVDSALVRAVVQAESAFKPDAVSVKGATGLMQLMPATAKRYGVSDRNDPVQNVNGGVRYLRDLLDMFGQNLALAVAAYNAGEGAVMKHRGIPPYSETQHYVRKVMRLLRMYQRMS